MITAEQYANHDCHLSQDDGCNTCDRWEAQGGMQKVPTHLQEFREALWKTFDAGFLSLDDYSTICNKNGLLLF